MTPFASFARLGMFAALTVALASACGGQSFTSDGGDAGSGAGSSAGSGQGGSTSHAGSGSAGKPHAGSATGGTSSAGTSFGGFGSVGGSGGAPADACAAAPDSGMCDAYFPAWYNDPSTGICRPFVYGGCGGNANRYPSLADCQKACPGGSPSYDSCKLPSDCVVTGTGCCGICDSAGITAHDLIAYNRQYTSLLQCGFALDIAAGGSASAGAAAPVACAPCPLPPAGQGTLKYFVPDCVAGQCVVEDLRTSPVTACTTSAECKVRRGTGCCESCDNGDLIGTRNDGSFEKLVCGGAPTPCAACLPGTTGAQPYCANGRCEVALPADAGG
jgi:hypothetical protein